VQVIKSIREDPSLASMLGLPQEIHEGDSRAKFEAVFQVGLGSFGSLKGAVSSCGQSVDRSCAWACAV
jgi:hypothetical protein